MMVRSWAVFTLGSDGISGAAEFVLGMRVDYQTISVPWLFSIDVENGGQSFLNSASGFYLGLRSLGLQTLAAFSRAHHVDGLRKDAS